MPVPSLTKVVSLFLVGSLGLCWVILTWWKEFVGIVGELKLTSEALLPIASLLAIPLAWAAGVILDGLADITLRRLVKFAARNPLAATLLRQRNMLDTMDRWRLAFEEALGGDPGRVYRSPMAHQGLQSRHVAAGIFQQHASPHTFEWVTSHFATYYLATSTGLVLLLGTSLPIRLALLGVLSNAKAALLVALMVGLVIAASSLAVDRYIYTYIGSFRFATIWLQEAAALRSSGSAATAPLQVEIRET